MKRNRYVHGWRGLIQCVYGEDGPGPWKYIHPCNLREAKRLMNNVGQDKKKNYRIYKLVEVTQRKAGRR